MCAVQYPAYGHVEYLDYHINRMEHKSTDLVQAVNDLRQDQEFR